MRPTGLLSCLSDKGTIMAEEYFLYDLAVLARNQS